MTASSRTMSTPTAPWHKASFDTFIQDKLPQLLDLKYHAVADAVAELGQVATIRAMFIGFQEHLYVQQGVA